jgi:uncharacterized membrane protein YkvA (DUF1232 family)
VVGYAFSPIDLIPDAIPVIGYLDDLVLIPRGSPRHKVEIPAPVLAECREKAPQALEERPTNRVAAALIVALWLSLAALAILLVARVI